MTSSSPLILWDRSRATTDWQCPRKRYWGYEYDGQGLRSEEEGLNLFLGGVFHDGFAAIATLHTAGEAVDINLISTLAGKQVLDALSTSPEKLLFAQEQSCMIEGLLRGFYRHQWPKLLEKYPVILFVEKEIAYIHNGLMLMSKPDLLLATSDGSETVYVEYKSTNSKREEWIAGWETAVQLHSTVRAVKQTLGIEVNSVIVQGLYKGYVSYGKQSSVFCYAYKRNSSPPFNREEVSYEYKPGMKRVPVWELEGGVKAWVTGMPEEILAANFPQTPPIFVNDYLIDRFFAQREIREVEINIASRLLCSPDKNPGDSDGNQRLLDRVFPQRFDQCRAWNRDCEFLRLCHSRVDNPLQSGYIYRVPHHQPELDRQQEA